MAKCACKHKHRSKKRKGSTKRRRSKGVNLGEIALWSIGAITLGKII